MEHLSRRTDLRLETPPGFWRGGGGVGGSEGVGGGGGVGGSEGGGSGGGKGEGWWAASALI